MAFLWTPVSAGTIATAAQINEVKTNTDTLASNLGIPAYSWSEMPVSAGDKMEAAQMTELQNALSYINTNNVCSADYAIHYSGNDTNQDTNIDGTRNVTINSGVETGYNNNYDPGYDNDLHTGYNVSVQTTNYGAYCSAALGSRDVTVYSVANYAAK